MGENTEVEKESTEGMSSETIKIVTIGVGGAGNNTINRLIKSGVKGTDLVAVNTDKQHLNIVHERSKKVLIGKSVTKGLGAGGRLQVMKAITHIIIASVFFFRWVPRLWPSASPSYWALKTGLPSATWTRKAVISQA